MKQKELFELTCNMLKANRQAIEDIKAGKKEKDRLNDGRLPILVVGEMGIGKSQIIAQAAKAMGVKFIDKRLAAVADVGDLTGLPEKDLKEMVTRFLRPDFIPKQDEECIILFDELNRAPTDIRQAVFQMLTDYRLDNYHLPDVCTIVACINPSDSIYQVNELDPAMITRCVKVTLEADTDQWLEYAHTKGFEASVVQFIAMHKEHLCKNTEKPPCPNPRTWEKVSHMLKNKVFPTAALNECLSGLVGPESALVFQKFCRENYNKPVSGTEILNQYDKVKEKLKKQRNDEMSATARDLNATLNSIKGKLKGAQVKNLEQFILDVSDEWAILILEHSADKVLNAVATDAVVDRLQELMKRVQEAKDAKPQSK